MVNYFKDITEGTVTVLTLLLLFLILLILVLRCFFNKNRKVKD